MGSCVGAPIETSQRREKADRGLSIIRLCGEVDQNNMSFNSPDYIDLQNLPNQINENVFLDESRFQSVKEEQNESEAKQKAVLETIFEPTEENKPEQAEDKQDTQKTKQGAEGYKDLQRHIVSINNKRVKLAVVGGRQAKDDEQPLYADNNTLRLNSFPKYTVRCLSSTKPSTKGNSSLNQTSIIIGPCTKPGLNVTFQPKSSKSRPSELRGRASTLRVSPSKQVREAPKADLLNVSMEKRLRNKQGRDHFIDTSQYKSILQDILEVNKQAEEARSISSQFSSSCKEGIMKDLTFIRKIKFPN